MEKGIGKEKCRAKKMSFVKLIETRHGIKKMSKLSLTSDYFIFVFFGGSFPNNFYGRI